MSRIARVPQERAEMRRQAQMTDGRSAAAGAVDDPAFSGYIRMIGAALDVSREQTLAIMANLNFMDFLAK